MCLCDLHLLLEYYISSMLIPVITISSGTTTIMKGLWLVLPALAGFVSGELERRNFITSCSEIELDPNRGLLNAFCSSKSSRKADRVSQVDLNGCLGWDSSTRVEDLDLPRNKLLPKDGQVESEPTSPAFLFELDG